MPYNDFVLDSRDECNDFQVRYSLVMKKRNCVSTELPLAEGSRHNRLRSLHVYRSIGLLTAELSFITRKSTRTDTWVLSIIFWWPPNSGSHVTVISSSGISSEYMVTFAENLPGVTIAYFVTKANDCTEDTQKTKWENCFRVSGRRSSDYLN